MYVNCHLSGKSSDFRASSALVTRSLSNEWKTILNSSKVNRKTRRKLSTDKSASRIEVQVDESELNGEKGEEVEEDKEDDEEIKDFELLELWGNTFLFATEFDRNKLLSIFKFIVVCGSSL